MKKKARVDEISKIVDRADFARAPEKSYGTWYKKSLRRKLRALVRKEILKCLEHLMAHGCNENAVSAYELWAKAGKP